MAYNTIDDILNALDEVDNGSLDAASCESKIESVTASLGVLYAVETENLCNSLAGMLSDLKSNPFLSSLLEKSKKLKEANKQANNYSELLDIIRNERLASDLCTIAIKYEEQFDVKLINELSDKYEKAMDYDSIVAVRSSLKLGLSGSGVKPPNLDAIPTKKPGAPNLDFKPPTVERSVPIVVKATEGGITPISIGEAILNLTKVPEKILKEVPITNGNYLNELNKKLKKRRVEEEPIDTRTREDLSIKRRYEPAYVNDSFNRILNVTEVNESLLETIETYLNYVGFRGKPTSNSNPFNKIKEIRANLSTLNLKETQDTIRDRIKNQNKDYLKTLSERTLNILNDYVKSDEKYSKVEDIVEANELLEFITLLNPKKLDESYNLADDKYNNFFSSERIKNIPNELREMLQNSFGETTLINYVVDLSTEQNYDLLNDFLVYLDYLKKNNGYLNFLSDSVAPQQ